MPEHITMLGAGATLIGSIYPRIMAYTGGHGIPCPLRALTGVPCPLCGLTTATVALTHAQWEAAARASPIVYPAAGLVVGTAPVLLARISGAAPPPRPWSQSARTKTSLVVSVIIALSWIFQLRGQRG
jgi:glycerol-3-phosphate acyltransferase PlsY